MANIKCKDVEFRLTPENKDSFRIEYKTEGGWKFVGNLLLRENFISVRHDTIGQYNNYNRPLCCIAESLLLVDWCLNELDYNTYEILVDEAVLDVIEFRRNLSTPAGVYSTSTDVRYNSILHAVCQILTLNGYPCFVSEDCIEESC